MNNQNKIPKKKHIVRNILLIIAGLIILLVCIIAFQANRNVRQMEICASEAISQISSENELHQVDCSEFSNFKIYGFMNFDTEQYEIEDLGNLCMIRSNGGVMQMLTMVITPAKKDLPLISVDYMYMLGNRTAYIEIYDLNTGESEIRDAAIERMISINSRYSSLADTVPTPAWYDSVRTTGSFKKVTSKEDAELLEMLKDYLTEYLKAESETELLTENMIPIKIDAMESYTHRLISEGGVSTDVFMKNFGKEKTEKFFDTVMFGTENYR